jgi:hypothetical protein
VRGDAHGPVLRDGGRGGQKLTMGNPLALQGPKVCSQTKNKNGRSSVRAKWSRLIWFENYFAPPDQAFTRHVFGRSGGSAGAPYWFGRAFYKHRPYRVRLESLSDSGQLPVVRWRS